MASTSSKRAKFDNMMPHNNPQASTQPIKLPPGPTRKEVREKSWKTTEKQRFDAKLMHLVEVVIDGAKKTVTLGDVERDAKLAHVYEMRSVINKNRIDAIERQISVMQSLDNVYVKRMGRESYMTGKSKTRLLSFWRENLTYENRRSVTQL
jgi:hypothetical protein